MRLMCKCMNLDGRCPNEHYADTLSPAPIILDQDADVPIEEVDGVHVLVQDFDVPEGALPVRMQVGDLPVTIVGWVAPGDGNMPSLLRSIAHEIEEIEKGRADS